MLGVARSATIAAPRHPLPVWAVLAGLALAGCTGLWPPGPSPGEAPVSQQDRAVAFFAAGHFGSAATAFHEVVETAPGSVAALNGLAAAYDHLGRYDLAARYYGRAMAVDRESPQTLNNIGYSYMLQGKFDLAVAFLRDAQRRDPNDPAIAANRAIAEAAVRASQPPPGAQWRAPSSKDADPPPHARIERTTPLVQTLIAQPASLAAADGVPWMPAPLAANGPAPPPAPDTLPAMLAAPIGDTRMAAAYDRLPGPIAASMADAWLAVPQMNTSGGDRHDSPG